MRCLKTYRATRSLLLEIEQLLAANQPSFKRSPLEAVIELLCRGRQYTWMGIYLAVGKKLPQQLLDSGGSSSPGSVTLAETRSKILVAMKLGGRELGVLDVESDQENAFGGEDRVLLENVAARLARFLAGPGKYLVRRAHPAPLPAASRHSAGAGEK